MNYKELVKNTFNLQNVVNNDPAKKQSNKDEFFVDQNVICKKCNNENSCVKVAIPYVLRYLTNELAAMNIRLSYTIK